MRQRGREEGGRLSREDQGGGSRGSSNSLTFDQGVKLWSSPESQSRLRDLPPLSGLNPSAELIRGGKSSRFLTYLRPDAFLPESELSLRSNL